MNYLVRGSHVGLWAARIRAFRATAVEVSLLLAGETVAESLMLLVTKRRGAPRLLVVMVMKQMMRLRKVRRRIRMGFFEDSIVARPARGLNHLLSQTGGVVEWIHIQVLLVSVSNPKSTSMSLGTAVGLGGAAAVRIAAAGVAALSGQLLKLNAAFVW